ncbi:MAG: efflux RND transporter periplasmic adaptor subunit [Planctomycetota bacterium]|jgi:RND family efflux transporter MFP subunit|nr:efflux RND transporter periplasmic adaptor subunit [Planctomycetota bacterium]
MSRVLKSLIAVLVIAAGTAGALWLLEWARPVPERRAATGPGPVPVAVRRLEPTLAEVAVQAFGTFEPLRQARVAPEVSGRLEWVRDPWRRGTPVAAGEALLRLDATLLDQQLALAAADLDRARAGVEAASAVRDQAQALLPAAREALELAAREERRLERLFEGGDASQSALDRAREKRVGASAAIEERLGALALASARRGEADEAVRAASAAEALARERRARAELHAPFDGLLVDPPPAVGTYLPAGASVLRLSDLSILVLILRINEDDLPGLRVGLPVRVSLPALPGEALEARVAAVGVEADPRTRTVAVEVHLPGSPAGAEGSAARVLRPGQFAEARIAVRSVPDALVLARSEFVWLDGAPTAFVVAEAAAGKTVEARKLTLGVRVEQGFVVSAGLVAGEWLVTAPLGRLLGGEPCVLREENEL